MKTSGNKYWFHEFRKARMPIVVNTGTARGNIMWVNFCQAFEPSISAASRSSFGISSKAFRAINKEKGMLSATSGPISAM